MLLFFVVVSIHQPTQPGVFGNNNLIVFPHVTCNVLSVLNKLKLKLFMAYMYLV